MSSLDQSLISRQGKKATDSLINRRKSLTAIDYFINNSSNYARSVSGNSAINLASIPFGVWIL